MSRSDRIVVATAGGALLLAGAALWMLLAPAVATDPQQDRAPLFVNASGDPAPSGGSDGAATIVVDVQGGVRQPGVRELVAGARVADAIDAAGGYASDADLAAASRINLAEELVDGAQVRVPRIGEAATVPAASGAVAAGPGGAGTGSGGPVDLNTATPEELEALPGIGPVTVQKIVAARMEQPFASLEDAVSRGVLDRGQLEDIQGLATAG